jgi:trehalose 6-phosphate synthase/phosphatase
MANLIIVSNRLPVSVKKAAGKLEFTSSTGGLATGLSGYTQRPGTKWIGWPGIASDKLTAAEKKQIARELKKQRCYPVFLTQKQIDGFYTGYSNGVLWPLFHGLPYAKHPASEWHSYQEVNTLYADTVLQLSKSRSSIWVHDYQLMLVPQLLRQAARGDTIGFFLHIPFASPKEFAALPQAKQLLRGILGSDLVGFHTRSYTRDFVESCETLMHLPAQGNRLLVGKRSVRAAEFPIGIDYERFQAATKQRTSRLQARRLRRKYKGQRIIVSVDRLDLTKGLVERLKAYQKLIRDNPKLAGKIVMVMIVSPSRTDVPEYKALKTRIDKVLKDIDKELSTPTWKPVDFRYEAVPLEEVMTYYQMADIAFITPIKDGMNLVAKEFLASKQNDGVLILSETAGAAEQLRDAVLVNPKKPRTMVNGLIEALTMPKKELKRRAKHMNQQIQEFSVQNWAETFIDTLQQPIKVGRGRTHTLNAVYEQKLRADYKKARRRLFLLDYDGVLHGLVSNPSSAEPSKQVLDLLKRLATDPKNDLMLVSGRSKDDLQKWFGHLPIGLAAEHGALIRRITGKKWHVTTSAGTGWKDEVEALFGHYAEQTPGAFVEQKNWATVWHYRGANPYYTQKHLVALRRLLKPIAKHYNLHVLEGHKVLEVRPADVNKRRAVQEWLIHDHDFILCIGDDVTDEDMFDALPTQAYSVKVGNGPTYARFRLKSVNEVLRLLGKL